MSIDKSNINKVKLGKYAGFINQGSNAIAIGSLAGRTNQTANSIIINATGTDLSSMDISGLFIAPIRNVTGITQSLYYNPSTNEVVYGDSGGGGGGTNYWSLTSGGSDIFNNTNSNNGNVGIGTGSVTSVPYKLDVSGETRIQTNNVRIGINAGFTNQIDRAVAIGYQAGMTNQGERAVAVGNQAGEDIQGFYTVAVGSLAGQFNQGSASVALGAVAGQNTQGANAVAIGIFAGGNTQGSGAVAIGYGAAQNTQGQNAVAIGGFAGLFTQGSASVAIGYAAAQNTQGPNAVAIGNLSGVFTQGNSAIAIGFLAGNSTQGHSAVSIGLQAGQNTQGDQAVAIGYRAGQGTQGAYAVAIGPSAGKETQGANAVSIGNFAGNNNQGSYAIAIGNFAGFTNQGNRSIAIGYLAGQTNQSANSIIINAAGTDLAGTSSGLFIDPIRQVTNNKALYYNTSTKEITYSDICSQWTSTGNNIYNNNSGNIGIGTNTPSSKLDVNGRAIIRDSLYMNGSDISDVSGIYFKDGTYIGHGSSFDINSNETIKFNNDKLVIDTYGRIGIGTVPLINYGDISFNQQVNVIKYNNTDNCLYIGGYFTEVTINGITHNANYICKIHKDNASFDDLNGGLDNYCHAIAINNEGNVYVGGEFTNVGNRIAMWDGSTWNTLDDGLNGPCYALGIMRPINNNNNDIIFVGGGFTSVGALPLSANNIAFYNTNLFAFFSGWVNIGDLNGPCYAIKINMQDVYVGGSFTQAGGLNSTTNIAKFSFFGNGYQWYNIGGITNNFNTGTCNAIEAINDDIFFGGSFSVIVPAPFEPPISANNIAKWNGVTSTWSIFSQDLNDTCTSISKDSNNNLYVGGSFTNVGNRIAKWSTNLSVWSSLGIGLDGNIKSIEIVNDNDIYVGGYFTTAGNVSANNFANWNNETWYNTTLLNPNIQTFNLDISGTVRINGPLIDIDNSGGRNGYLLESTGNGIRWSTSKTFIVDHPNNTAKYLVHACLEGPEVGLYYRGHGIINENEKFTTIYLPDYLHNFAYDFTINITQTINDDRIEDICSLATTKVNNCSFKVYRKDITMTKSYFDWTVMAKRGDIIVEPYKKDVVVKGDGPYKYI